VEARRVDVETLVEIMVEVTMTFRLSDRLAVELAFDQLWARPRLAQRDEGFDD
jgi:hypothetical protein